MPNTPALLGEGSTGISPGKCSTKEDLENAKVLANAKNMFELLKSMELQLNQYEKLSDGTLGKIWFDKWQSIKKDVEKLDS